MKIFEKLEEKDLQLLLDAPVLITILIGSADGDLDQDEILSGKTAALIKASTEERILHDYYDKVNEIFDDRMKFFIARFPASYTLRNEKISTRLAGLNKVYESLDQNFVEELNKSLRSLAQQVAQASGGILGFASESYEEKQWVGLSMIKS